MRRKRPHTQAGRALLAALATMYGPDRWAEAIAKVENEARAETRRNSRGVDPRLDPQ